MSDRGYPVSWESTGLLKDGRTVHIRPITPDDEGALTRFHATLSDSSVYLRYFAPHPMLSAADLRHLTVVDYEDRVALVALHADRIVGVARFDRVDEGSAEVAFVVCDAYQGCGLGALLLERLAGAARDRGLRALVAEVLPRNVRMLKTFERSGLPVTRHTRDGVVELFASLEPIEDARMNP